MGFGGLFLFGYLVATSQLGAIPVLNGEQLGWVGISALLLIGFVTTWYLGLRHVDVSVATSVLVLAFPITLLLGVVAGRTSFGLIQAGGVVTIAFGVVLVIGLASLREAWVTLDRIVRARPRSTRWR
jgi:drug/metabolite transporter (DMT)-like permease